MHFQQEVPEMDNFFYENGQVVLGKHNFIMKKLAHLGITFALLKLKLCMINKTFVQI